MKPEKERGLIGSISNKFCGYCGIQSNAIFKCIEFLKYQIPSNPEILVIIGMEGVQSCPK